MLHPLVLAVILILFTVAKSPAQTVEAVLRALQERALVAAQTNQDLITWPNGLASFPQDGAISDLGTALSALNVASRQFDDIKYQYIAFDPVQNRAMNLSRGNILMQYNGKLGLHQPYRELNLPSVGEFTEANWQSKLKKLASNIDQLRAILWKFSSDYSNASMSLVADADTDVTVSSVDLTGFTPSAGTAQDNGGNNGVNVMSSYGADMLMGQAYAGLFWYFGGTHNWDVTYDVDDNNDSYVVETGWQINCSLSTVTAVHTEATLPDGVTVPPNAFNLDGSMILLKYALPSTFPPEPTWAGSDGKLFSGARLPIPLNRIDQGVFEIGDYDSDPDPEFDSSITMADVVNEAQTWLKLPNPTMAGNVNTFGMIPTDLTGLYPGGPLSYGAYESVDAKYNAVDGNTISVGLDCVYLPSFTEFLPASAKQFSDTPAVVGNVELTVENFELVRVHIGRGLHDLNQVAWLGTNPDGFGSLVFGGSPKAFDVRYQEDPTAFDSGDQAVGGATYANLATVDFTAQQEQQSGFSDRSEYLDEYFKPRLKQVMGSDVLINVTYNSAYCKTIDFYWASQIGPLSGNFYDVSGQTPFKTVMLQNPTGPANGAGLPTTEYDIRVWEDNTVCNEVKVSQIVEEEETNPEYQITFTRGESAGDNQWQQVITVPNGSVSITGTDLDTGPITIAETNEGQSTTISAQYMQPQAPANGPAPGVMSPLITEWPVLQSQDVTAGGVTRHVSLQWNQGNWDADNLSYITTLSQGGFSGDPAWSETGRTMNFDGNGQLTSDSRTIGGGTLQITKSLNGNALTTNWLFNGQQFRSQTATYNDSFASISIADAGFNRTLTIGDISGMNSPPWTLSKVADSNGFTRTYTYTPSGPNLTVVAKEGWGAGFSSGTTTTTNTDGIGDIVNRLVTTTEGVVLSSFTGTAFTPWGAASTATNERQETATFNYNLSGHDWGRIASVTDWSGATESVGSYDWLNRPESISKGTETITFDYTNALSPTFNSNANYSGGLNFSPFGDVSGGNSTFGVGSSFQVNPTGQSTSTVDGRTVDLGIDPSGMLNSIGNGQGSRGGSQLLSADSNGLYTKITQLNNAGSDSSNVVTTHYDAFGRPVSVQRPAASGGTVTDQWSYNDAARTVTFTPGDGPTTLGTVSTLSSDGSTLTVTRGGNNYLQKVRSVQNGSLVFTTSLFDDSAGGGGQWNVISAQAFNPTAGTTTITPWGLQPNALTLTDTASSRQISGGPGNDTITISKAQGLPTLISGTMGGATISLTPTNSYNLLSSLNGTIGGLSAELSLDTSGRVTNLTVPGSSQTFNYGNSLGNFQVSMSDSQQGTSGSFTANSVGDPTAISLPNSLALTLNTTDTSSGHQTIVNSSLTMQSNFDGTPLTKGYPGITDTNVLNTDGSVRSRTDSGAGGSASVSFVQTPTSRTTTYSGGTIQEYFYNAGPRKSVSATNDTRTETWQYGQLQNEVFTAGPWSGWEIDRTPDASGRLGTLTVKQNGTTLKTFTFNYDQYSQLSGSTGLINAVYAPRDTAGRLSSLTRGLLTSGWGYNPSNGLIQSLGHTGAAGSFTFGFTYNTQSRIASRTATTGVSWNSMLYTGIGQLAQVLPVPARASTVTYGYDTRGNRNAGTGYAQGTTTLDQVGSRNMSSRGFVVSGTVNPAATVSVQTSLAPSWQGLTVSPQDGSFSGSWSVPANYNSGASALISVSVLGSLAGGGYQGATALSESDLLVSVPPVAESLGYDGPGDLSADAYWTYQWDSLGRLTQMTRKAGTSTIVGASGEVLTFAYDGDGRRTNKTHTITYTNGTTEVDTSQVLWSGWLPIAEQRTVNGTAQPRRWFQWGVDRSGTLEGAGGIGGLMAIQEEGGRTLIPIDDGLGNIIAVIDASTGQAVAYYNYGPFGEPYSQNGDMTACPFRFQTKWYDDECQHYYFGYRYYDPSQGRWLSRDPAGEAGGFNLYAYCNNDPVNRWDYLGMADNGFYPSPGWQRQFTTTPTILDVLMPITAAEMKGGRSPWDGLKGATEHSQTVTQPVLKIAAAGYGAEGALPFVAPVALEVPAAAGAASDLILKSYVTLENSSLAQNAMTFLAGLHIFNLVTDEEYRGQILSFDGGTGISSINMAADDIFSAGRSLSSRIPSELPGTWNPLNWRPLYEGPTTGGLPTNWRYTGSTFGKILNADEIAQFEALAAAYPEWMPKGGLDAPATLRTIKENAAARALFKGRGHHPHPLKFGGEPNPSELVPTGETRTVKNPTHTEITNFWNAVLRRILAEGSP